MLLDQLLEPSTAPTGTTKAPNVGLVCNPSEILMNQNRLDSQQASQGLASPSQSRRPLMNPLSFSSWAQRLQPFQIIKPSRQRMAAPASVRLRFRFLLAPFGISARIFWPGGALPPTKVRI